MINGMKTIQSRKNDFFCRWPFFLASDIIASWRKSANSCLSKLQMFAIRHLNELQYDLQLELEQRHSLSYHCYSKGQNRSIAGLSPYAMPANSKNAPRDSQSNPHQHFRSSRHRRLSLPEVWHRVNSSLSPSEPFECYSSTDQNFPSQSSPSISEELKL